MTAPDCPCPLCGKTGHLLAVSDVSMVDYYRCDFCSHTWTVPKGECDPATHVTIPA